MGHLPGRPKENDPDGVLQDQPGRQPVHPRGEVAAAKPRNQQVNPCYWRMVTVFKSFFNYLLFFVFLRKMVQASLGKRLFILLYDSKLTILGFSTVALKNKTCGGLE